MRCCRACGAVYRAELVHCVTDGTALTETDRDPLIGKRIGSYKVDDLIGQGGMGRVYRAHHLLLAHKRCALKVLIGDFGATPAMRIRFAKEAENASRLSHPNIAAVTDFGRTDNGLLFLAMELVDGPSLERLIGGEPMAPARVVAFARQLCEGLAHAHDLGLIHRDFKPDNILVAGGVPKIVDFGLAIVNETSDVRLTTTGIVMGTPAYVAPEQCTRGELDPRADLYALGVTMFEALTGGFLPFDGEAAEIVGLKVATRAPTLAERAPHITVPAGLAMLVERLLARKPEDRPRDARAVIAALDEIERAPDAIPVAARARKRSDDTIADTEGRRESRPARAIGSLTQRVRKPDRTLAIAVGGLAIAIVAAALIWSRRAPDVAAAVEPPPARVAAAVDPAPPPTAVDPAAAPAVVPPTDPPRESPAAVAPRESATGQPAPRESAGEQLAARESAGEPAAAVAPASKRRRPTRASARVATPKPAPVEKPAPVAVRAGSVIPTPPPVEKPVEVTPPPAPKRVELDVAIAGLTVDGALPSTTIRHALDRVMPELRACRRGTPGVVAVRFSIGESRRASGTTASGMPADVNGCVVSAIAGLRTEAAPDVGDVDVHVRVAFARRE